MMEIRNARLIRTGVIECEINHPDLGWLPFGAVNGDPGLPGRVYAAAIGVAVDVRGASNDP
ncbi:MAG: hypothetical protein Q4G22_04820 [Paracoccus sp. (in: a-proteobacteria)]|uniref:hypothetical protein n=1 Tax=Paracoccus sp. TaxID=267 RepID=UPI0026DFCB9A|nr:hypothetical protein [Paracoccus sp. (in: a-proteobacteria)]MDO5631142.1 hypothetical protein [Paracoccus sp. (in: a-proteobacteria)]